MAVSMLFKSEQASGLLFFGTYSTPFSAPRGASSSSNGGRELGARVQVHFVGGRVMAAVCSLMADGGEKCFSCAVDLEQEFASADRWVRVSLFHQFNYQFLSVDHQICLLSPNAHAVDPAELYRISATNVLLVGGAFYAKHALLSQRVADQFRRDFQDNTREKAPSLKGCVAEVVVRGQRQNLSSLLTAQMHRARKSEEQAELGSIFSLQRGCPECPAKCQGAPCSREWNPSAEKRPPICRCSALYAAESSGGGGCRVEEEEERQQQPSAMAVGLPSAMAGGLRLTATETVPAPPLSVPVRPTPSSALGRSRSRLERIWLLLRLPEANEPMHPFLGIGSLQVSVGQNGHRLVVESRDYDLIEEFLLPQPLDARLHLLAIERSPAIGTASTAGSSNLLTIRLDNDYRRLAHLDEMPIASLDGQSPSIEVRPLMPSPESSTAGEANGIDQQQIIDSGLDLFGAASGCVEELVFHYEMVDEPLSTLSFGFDAKTHFQQQLDYVDQFRQQFPALFPPPAANIKCGIRDPALWTGNSTSWGRIGESGGGEGGGPIGFILKKGSSLPRISLLVTTTLILLILVALSVYMFYAIKRHNQTNDNGSTDKFSTGSKTHFDKLKAADHERRPLKLVMEEDQQWTAPGGGTAEMASNQQPNGHAKNGSELNAPPRPPKSPVQFAGHLSNGVDKPSTNDWSRTPSRAEPLSIQPLDGSPKLFGAGGALRVTPLRSQPLRNGNNGGGHRSQAQSPLAFQRAQFFGTPPATSPPNSLEEKDNGARMAREANNNNKIHQLWPTGSSGGFFTPSPTSGTSSTSPGSSSSQGNDQLMRPPVVRVAAINSRQPSPIGSAAPIACKEEL